MHSSANLRRQAFTSVISRLPKVELRQKRSVENIFGGNVFGKKAMREALAPETLERLGESARSGAPLDKETAEAVALAIREWAVERGATHYSHVFYPLNGQTAEKHESFFAPDADGGLISNFNGRCLVSGEPDASSLPSGGLRTTFEARGVTAWDPRCAPYLVINPYDPDDVVLAIPSTFAMASGEALDEKTPLARSSRAVSHQAGRVLAALGAEDEGDVYVNAGVEQEYFLVDRQFYQTRPDLSICGRTLMGARPPKGQQFEDQYFGAIPERVQAYMLDFERELWQLGIAAQTRHNEVAPSQYEFVPYFERDHMASDHQQVIMQVMQKVAARHGFACLLHEKPFAGINGSGKHVNWSLHTEKRNLFRGGSNPLGNVPFLVFTAAVLRGVHRYARLLRAVTAGAGNDLRLGANEAPPAIISVFLGEKLECVFEQLATGRTHTPRSAYDDRNRTSPFSYAGTRFEFRMVGASQPVASPLTVLNTILAESLDFIAKRLEEALPAEANAEEREIVALRLVGEIYREHMPVVFNGDGYCEAWRQEAKARGLPEIIDSVEAFAAFALPEHIELFERFGVMSAREINSRSEIYFDRYIKQVRTEGSVSLSMAEQHVLSAAYRHQGELAGTALAMTKLRLEPHIGQLEKATDMVRELENAIDNLRDALDTIDAIEEPAEQAAHCRDKILPAMNKVRNAADRVETTVADDLWLLPTYREMLFVK